MASSTNGRRSSIGSRNNTLAAKSRRSSLYSRNGGHGNHNEENDGIVKVPLIGYEVMEERARFTVFKLRIENEELNDSWLVCRRYTDFERLSAKLKEEFPQLSINLPPKRWLKNNFDASFLEDRMKGLQAFVDCILVQHKLGNSPIVRSFFCLDEPPLYPENAEESRAIFGNLEESVLQLKETLDEKEAEIELLRAELTLVKVQNERLIKLNSKFCRTCSRKVHHPLSPTARNGEPIASSTPNIQNSSISRNRNPRSAALSLPSTPKAKLSFKFSEHPTSKSSEILLPKAEIENPEAVTPRTYILASSAVPQEISTANDSYYTTSPKYSSENGDFSPFEQISSTGFITSKDMERNSSFEILSPAHSTTSTSSKDTNHNRKEKESDF